ncbi:MAG: glutamine amidotransferase [Paracoccaceae bacterium]
MKPFLILQLRPETEASDDEFAAILRKGGLRPDDVRRVRLEREALPADLRLDDYCGVIVGGGPGCVSDPPQHKSAIEARIEAAVLGLMPQICEQDIPYLGCCYGIGVLGLHLDSHVSQQRFGEPVGASECHKTGAAVGDALLAGLPASFAAFVGHKEALQELPPGCTHLLSSSACPFQMIRYKSNVYATQFHPEADAAGFALRIRIYRDRGYFPPHDADRLIKMCADADVTMPERILGNFVTRYRRN